MTLSLLFWIIYIIALIFGLWVNYTPGQFKPLGSHAVIMLLLGILGWAVYGPAIK